MEENPQAKAVAGYRCLVKAESSLLHAMSEIVAVFNHVHEINLHNELQFNFRLQLFALLHYFRAHYMGMYMYCMYINAREHNYTSKYQIMSESLLSIFMV
jgi:hypothetical protein